jgi:hypothetical protein
MQEKDREAISSCAVCLRALANTKRYDRYRHAILSLVEALEKGLAANDTSMIQDVHTDLQTVCRHSDALDAEIHRSILNCLNRATSVVWPQP